MDTYGNQTAREGWDRCACGCKYWQNDECIDCGASVEQARAAEAEAEAMLAAEKMGR